LGKTVAELLSQNISNAASIIKTWSALVYNVKAYGAKGDGITNDALAIQAAINAASAAGGGTVFFPAGTYLIASQLNVPSFVVLEGASSNASVLVGNFAGFILKFNYIYNEVRNLKIKGHTTTQGSAVAKGIDMEATPHHWNLDNVRFENLIQAFSVKGGYMGTIKDVYVTNCGDAATYACFLGTQTAGGYETNNVNYTNFHIEGAAAWPGKGLYIANLDHSFHGLHLEYITVPDAFTSDAKGVVIDGLYVEHHTTTADNQLTFNQQAVVNGGLINGKVNTNKRVVFNGTNFYVSQDVVNKTFNNCIFADNRMVGDISTVGINEFGLNNRGELVELLTNSGTFEEWGIGFSGDTNLRATGLNNSSRTIVITNTAGEFYTGTRGLKVTKVADAGNGGSVAFKFPIDFFNASDELYAWAIVKVPTGQTIQCSFGLGSVSFGNPERLMPLSSANASNWTLAIVGPFLPASDYVTFNINKVGGGAPPNGEYFLVDSFGVCKNGISFENLLKRSAKELEKYRYATAAPTTGTWAQGDKVFNASPAASGYEGWVCVTAGTPGTWKGFGQIQA
jgi:hypothetical protein